MANYCTINSTHLLDFQQLIPGLPHDLALECLLRVPLISHPTLRLVSHLWKSTVSHPSFFSYRRRARFAENYVFLIQPPPPPSAVPQDNVVIGETDDKSVTNVGAGPLAYNLNVFNTNHEEWRCLAGITIPTFAQCLVLPALRKLVVLGGLDPATLEPVSRVYILDLAVGSWREGSPMPKARSFFACAAAGPATIYVAGGHDGQKNALRSAEAYDAVADKWQALPPMAEERDESYGLSLTNDGKFWVVSGYGTESQGRFRPDAEVYDPKSNSWVVVPGVWPYPGNNPKSTAVVTIDGQQRWWHVMGGEIKEFEWDGKVWKGVNMGSIPDRVTGMWASLSSMSLINVGNGKILLMGNGENCGGESLLILEKANVNWTWQHVDAPPRFSGFPFSASHLLI